MTRIPQPVRIALVMWAMLTAGGALFVYGLALAAGEEPSLAAYLYNSALIFGGLTLLWGGVFYAVWQSGG